MLANIPIACYAEYPFVHKMDVANVVVYLYNWINDSCS